MFACLLAQLIDWLEVSCILGRGSLVGWLDGWVGEWMDGWWYDDV